jgi:hypothetical protein
LKKMVPARKKNKWRELLYWTPYKNMEWKLQFALAIAETNHIKLVDEMRKKEQKKLQFDELTPKAAAKFEKHGRNMDKLTVKELEALSFVVFGVSISGSGL